MKISAVLIVKDEAPIIAQCLESIKDFDEIVVVDTGSTDGTQDICRSFGAKVYEDYKWNDDFAEARNHANDKATGDWIYSIDADHTHLTPVEDIRKEVAQAEAEGHKALWVESVSERGGHVHYRELLFKNDPSIRWVGPVHEVLNVVPTKHSCARKLYGYSDNHKSDSERNIRILKERCDITRPRTMFYLAREYYERKRYDEAIEWANKYLQKAFWIPEAAEACLLKAWCYWMTNRGNEAREACGQAIRWNPDFKEALQFMAKLHYEPWKSKWLRLAEAATNTDVLFVRT